MMITTVKSVKWYRNAQWEEDLSTRFVLQDVHKVLQITLVVWLVPSWSVNTTKTNQVCCF